MFNRGVLMVSSLRLHWENLRNSTVDLRRLLHVFLFIVRVRVLLVSGHK